MVILLIFSFKGDALFFLVTLFQCYTCLGSSEGLFILEEIFQYFVFGQCSLVQQLRDVVFLRLGFDLMKAKDG